MKLKKRLFRETLRKLYEINFPIGRAVFDYSIFVFDRFISDIIVFLHWKNRNMRKMC